MKDGKMPFFQFAVIPMTSPRSGPATKMTQDRITAPLTNSSQVSVKNTVIDSSILLHRLKMATTSGVNLVYEREDACIICTNLPTGN